MQSSGYNLALEHVHDGGPRFIPIIATNRQTEAGRRIELGLGSEAVGYTQWNLQGGASLLEMATEWAMLRWEQSSQRSLRGASSRGLLSLDLSPCALEEKAISRRRPVFGLVDWWGEQRFGSLTFCITQYVAGVSLSFCCFCLHLSKAGITGVFHHMEHVEFFTLFKMYFLHFFILCGCVCAIAYTWRSYYNSVGSVLPFTLQALKMWCRPQAWWRAPAEPPLQPRFITFGFNVYHYYFIPILFI